jgi:hypothetical protein
MFFKSAKHVHRLYVETFLDLRDLNIPYHRYISYHKYEICNPFHSDRMANLKVPKREIFDRSDFPDFYTIKPLRVGDFGVKIKKFVKNI